MGGKPHLKQMNTKYTFNLYRTETNGKDFLFKVIKIVALSANQAQSKFNKMSLPNYSFYTKSF